MENNLLVYEGVLSTSNSSIPYFSNANIGHQTACGESARVTLGRSVKARPK